MVLYQIARDRFRRAANQLAELRQPLRAEPLNRAGDTDGPDDLAARPKDRCRDTAQAHLDLLVIERYPSPSDL